MKNGLYTVLRIISFIVLLFGLLGLGDNMRERTTPYILILVISAVVFGYTLSKTSSGK